MAEGASTSFNVTPMTGYEVASVGGTCGGSLSGTTYTTDAITAACSVDASFSEIVGPSYSVVASAGSNGSISPSGTQAVSEGASISFTLTASGYESCIGGWDLRRFSVGDDLHH